MHASSRFFAARAAWSGRCARKARLVDEAVRRLHLRIALDDDIQHQGEAASKAFPTPRASGSFVKQNFAAPALDRAMELRVGCIETCTPCSSRSAFDVSTRGSNPKAAAEAACEPRRRHVALTYCAKGRVRIELRLVDQGEIA